MTCLISEITAKSQEKFPAVTAKYNSIYLCM